MKSRVHNPKYLEKYFTQFPNIIDDWGLDPYEYRLLLHYYRVGECWEGVRKTAEICKMSTGKVANSRKTLEEKGLIKITENGDGIIIHLVDLSKQNLEKYAEQTVHVVNTYKDRGCSCGEKGCSCGEHKKNQSKKNPLSDSKESGSELFPELTVTKQKPDSKKATGPKYEEYHTFQEIWLKHYPKVGIQMPRDGAKINWLIEETRRQVQLEPYFSEPTPENVCKFWEIFVACLGKTWAHGNGLHTIASHYPSLIFAIEHGKQRKQSTSKTTDALNYLEDLEKGLGDQ
jgi:DNA-binding MarR family transcriptional regulator